MANLKPPGYLRLRCSWQFLDLSDGVVPGPVYTWKASKPKVMTYHFLLVTLELTQVKRDPAHSLARSVQGFSHFDLEPDRSSQYPAGTRSR